jgi:CBS domain-containing protein
MTTNVTVVTPGMDIHHAIKALLEGQISGAPVVAENGELVGVLSIKDCLKIAFSASYHKERGGPVAQFMSPEVETMEADTDIVAAAEFFLKSRYRRFPVMANDRLVGVISRYDVLKALLELW